MSEKLPLKSMLTWTTVFIIQILKNTSVKKRKGLIKKKVIGCSNIHRSRFL